MGGVTSPPVTGRQVPSPLTPPAPGGHAYVRWISEHDVLWQTRPGDFLLCHRERDALSDALALREWIAGRLPGLNHAGLFVGLRGELAEITARGAEVGNAKAYADGPMCVVTVLDSIDQRRTAVRTARELMDREEPGVALSWAATSGLPIGLNGPRLVAGALFAAGVKVDPTCASLAELRRLADCDTISRATWRPW